MAAEPGTAAAAFARAGQDAVTYSRRGAGEARARNHNDRGEDAGLRKKVGAPAAEPGTNAVRNAAKRFRAATGYPVPEPPAPPKSVPPKRNLPPRPARSGDDEEYFSQSRIMIRDE